MAGAPPVGTLFEVLSLQADEAAEHEAVVTPNERLTYGELRDLAGQIGQELIDRDIGPGDPVALLADNRADWIAVAMGVAAVGARLVALNTWAKAWEIDHMLGHAKPCALFTVDRLGKQDFLAYLGEILPELGGPQPAERSQRFPDLRDVVIMGQRIPPGAEAFAAWTEAQSDRPAPAVGARPTDIAMVMFTSGSAARPKAVSLSHRHLIENGFSIGQRQGLGPDDRVFLASPLFWAYGGANALMAAMTHRATLVLQSQFRPTEALELIEQEGCTAIYTLPAMTHALVDVDGFSRARVRTVRTGLTIGPPEEIRLVADGLGVEGICNIYGSSETYGNCCVTPWDAPLERRLHSQGPPLPGVEVRIVDHSGAELPSGGVGEIQVRGRITPGYLDADGRPEPLVDDDGFFHTGDLGTLDENGWVSFQGRLSEMIKTAGINVSPSEVEAFLATHPDVIEVGVVGRADPVRGEEVVAFVRLTEGSNTPAEELRSFCRERIASYKVPSVIQIVDALPLTHTGKLSRRELGSWAEDLSGSG